MPDTKLDYERDVRIDADSLDVEWLNQAALGLRYSKNAAYMKRLAAKAEERVKVVRAELVAQVNASPVKLTGKEKPTSADIEAYYRTQPEHLEAKQELLNAQYEADYAQMAHMEISLSRKTALEMLVRLNGQQYFAGPSVPRDLSKEWRQKQEESNTTSDISDAMKGRRRTK